MTVPVGGHSYGPGVTVGALNGLKAVLGEPGYRGKGKPRQGGGGQCPTPAVGSTPRYAQMTLLMDLVYGVGHGKEGCEEGGGGRGD